MPNIQSRLSHSIIDELGLDPLRDSSFEALQTIKDFTLYNVSESDEFNLPLIAHRTYGDKQLWWVLLVYNKFADIFEIKRGTRLKIPSYSKVISALSDNLRNDTQIEYVEI